MADIVIRGMEEPMRCSACRMLEGDTDDGFCHAANKWFDDEWFRWYLYPEGDIATDKPLNCPLIPLPEGHGRLGDLDKINASLEAMIEIEHNQRAAPYSWSHAYMEMQGILDDAPIIVPAEGGTSE